MNIFLIYYSFLLNQWYLFKISLSLSSSCQFTHKKTAQNFNNIKFFLLYTEFSIFTMIKLK